MTNKEAINELKELKEDYWDDDGYGHETKQYDDTMAALDMAISALEQQPCEDTISRQTAIDIVEFECGEWKGLAKEIVKHFNGLPSAQPKVGHWIYDEILIKHYYCSECKSMGVDYWDYCPNCGAKMESEDKE